jgi:23S rRNA pseudouridine1911/1915/1917 synthase
MTTVTIGDDLAGQTLAAAVRRTKPALSWSQARRLIDTRHVRINRELWLDPARRVKSGDVLEILSRPERLPKAFAEDLVVRHLDDHVIVVEKPAGINTVRHPSELNWDIVRRGLSPTLEDLVQKMIAARLRVPSRPLPRLRKVHRLDKLTSGLLVFARSAMAEQALGRQFRAHTVDRRYLAIVPGRPKSQAIRSWLVRDRGDGRRGTSPVEGHGKLAVTHIEKVEPIGEYSVVTCRLETGRTHQIRIHLAELGHPVCGDPVYHIQFPSSSESFPSPLVGEGKGGASPLTPHPNPSPQSGRGEERRKRGDDDAPRLALHAAELGFVHPATRERLHWTMPLPNDLRDFLERLGR